MSERKSAILVFSVAAFLRFALWLHLTAHPELLIKPDTPGYLKPAQNLLSHGHYSASDGPPWIAEANRTPGYPAFLTAHLFFTRSILAPAATQSLLDAGTAALVSLSAVCVSAEPAAWVVGLLYALDPVAIVHAPLLMTEPLFCFLLTLTLWLLLKAGSKASGIKRIGLAGLCLGFGTLVRPISLYLWIPWGLALARAWRPVKKELLALIFMAAAVMPVSLWCLRNWIEFNHFEYSTIIGINALLWDAPAVQATAQNKSLDEARQELAQDFSRRWKAVADPFEESRLRRQIAKEIIFAHPGALIKLRAVSTLKMLLGPGIDLIAQMLSPLSYQESAGSPVYAMRGTGTRLLLRGRPWLWLILAWEAFLLFLSYSLAIWGICKLARHRDRWVAAACLIPAIYLLLISAGGQAYYRFRLPLMPIFAVLAAVVFTARNKGDMKI